MYVETKVACRGGLSPGSNAGMKNYNDRACKSRCNTNAACTGYVLPVNGNNWCETYTSKEATGDGRMEYACYMKTKAGMYFVHKELFKILAESTRFTGKKIRNSLDKKN